LKPLKKMTCSGVSEDVGAVDGNLHFPRQNALPSNSKQNKNKKNYSNKHGSFTPDKTTENPENTLPRSCKMITVVSPQSGHPNSEQFLKVTVFRGNGRAVIKSDRCPYIEQIHKVTGLLGDGGCSLCGLTTVVLYT
jgi:hypothetical protein